MRKFIWLVVIFCIILAVNSAKAKKEKKNKVTSANEPDANVDYGKLESNELISFGLRLYRKIYNDQKNLIFSPFSFRILYSMIYQTSRNALETQLRELLFSKEMDGVNKTQVIKSQVKSFNKILNYDNIRFGNKIYMRKMTALAPALKKLATKYNSEVEQVDFSKPLNIVKQMNKWAEEKTNGLIKNMVSKTSVTKDTALYILNTIYFRALWLQPFADHNLVHTNFTSVDGVRKSIQFIRHEGDYKVASLNEFKVDVLQLPYEHDKFVFWIMLPYRNSSLNDLKTIVKRKVIRNIGKELKVVYSKIEFPVFEIESKIDGRKISPWIFNRRDLHMLDNIPPLGVDEIKQKTKIIVNQHGTESSSNRIIKEDKSRAGLAKFEFIADRPFMFSVLTADRYEPVFIGHYVQA